MGHSIFDDASHERVAWKAGKKVGAKRPFTQKQIRATLDGPRAPPPVCVVSPLPALCRPQAKFAWLSPGRT